MNCDHLVGRMREICEGTSGLPKAIEEQYRALWMGKSASNSCQYRGEHIDNILCPDCPKKVQIKVFGCQLFSKCVMTESIGKLKGCVGCESRLEKQPE